MSTLPDPASLGSETYVWKPCSCCIDPRGVPSCKSAMHQPAPCAAQLAQWPVEHEGRGLWMRDEGMELGRKEDVRPVVQHDLISVCSDIL